VVPVADSTKIGGAQGKQAAAPKTPPSKDGGTTPLKTPVNPGAGGSRMPSVPAPAGNAAPGGGAALVAKWMPQADELTKGSAQQLLTEVEPVIGTLTGESQGNAYFLVAMAYGKLDNASDSCSMMEKAKPLVKGRILSVANAFIEATCK
jgi:hypothetical protein